MPNFCLKVRLKYDSSEKPVAKATELTDRRTEEFPASTENVAGNQGVLSIHDANHGVINLLLGGHYLAGGHSISSASSTLFSLATDGGTGALLTTSSHV